MNLFATKPELPPLVQREWWTCPITGLVVPKTADANLKWRAELLEQAEKDRALQIDLYTACSQSLLFWINAFCFTLRVFETRDGQVKQAENSVIPFVTWDIQDKHLLRLEHCIDEGESLLTDKSRDMGATWDHVDVLTHRFLFRSRESHLVISRKEDAVDILDGHPKDYPHGPLSDPGTLFGKIDFILSYLPEWMLPRITRKKLHIINLDNHSRIDGESSNATAGSSDRRKSIFLDEFAKVDESESIKRGTRDVTACRLVCSTPNGPGTTFSKWRLSGTIPVFELAWWEHPEKGANRHAEQDSLGRWRIRSPWYDNECVARSPKELAIEVDMDHLGSGETFFEPVVIEQQKKLFARPPRRHMTIRFKKKVTDEDITKAAVARDIKKVFYSAVMGQWKVWCELHKGRPDQSKTYTIGVDISKGQGASNSVMSIYCNDTREKIAEFADPDTPPHELARLSVAAAIWCGGRHRPLLIWENNGDPGFDFGRQLVHTYRYPNIYFDKQSGTVRERTTKRYGWRSSPEKKAAALGLLRRAYSQGRFKNPCEAALNECLMYVYYEGGGIGPAELVQESDSARKTHGDRVIADMLCLVGAADYRLKKEELTGSKRSFARRFQNWKREKQFRDKNGRHPSRFNFAVSV